MRSSIYEEPFAFGNKNQWYRISAIQSATARATEPRLLRKLEGSPLDKAASCAMGECLAITVKPSGASRRGPRCPMPQRPAESESPSPQWHGSTKTDFQHEKNISCELQVWLGPERDDTSCVLKRAGRCVGTLKYALERFSTLKNASLRGEPRGRYALECLGAPKSMVAFFRQPDTFRASPIRARSYRKLFAMVLRAIMRDAWGKNQASNQLLRNRLYLGTPQAQAIGCLRPRR